MNLSFFVTVKFNNPEVGSPPQKKTNGTTMPPLSQLTARRKEPENWSDFSGSFRRYPSGNYYTISFCQSTFEDDVPFSKVGYGCFQK